MRKTECNSCGLSVYDLPDDIGDPEMVRDQFFDFDDAGNLYCKGCTLMIRDPHRGVALTEAHEGGDQ